MEGSKRTNAIIKNVVWGLCTLLFILLFWTVFYLIIGKDTVVASPWDTVVKAFVLFGQSAFWTAFGGTLFRAFIAFCVSAVLALVFALISYLYPTFGRIFTGICAFLRALPTMAVFLLLLLLFVRAEVPVAVGVLTLMPVLFTAYYNAFCGVDKGLLEMSKVFQVERRKLIKHLYLPAMKNPLILESAAGFSFAMKVVVSAEILASFAGGLGGQMQEASMFGQPTTLFALTLVVCLVGILVEWVASLFVKEGV